MPDCDNLKPWFSQQIETNMDSLYSLALRLTRNSADAEDLVAEAVSKAWLNIKKLNESSRFRPWLFRILHNCFISDYRKQSVRPSQIHYDETATDNNKEEISCLLIKQPNEFLNWWANPEREFSNQILGEDIMQAIESLPEMFRITILLVNVEGFSYDEAAKILEVPPGTIRSRMKRGRTLLQKSLWQHASDAGLITTETIRE